MPIGSTDTSTAPAPITPRTRPSPTYGYAAGFALSQSCEREVVEQLLELSRRAADYARRDGWVARDEYFVAEQNARLVDRTTAVEPLERWSGAEPQEAPETFPSGV